VLTGGKPALTVEISDAISERLSASNNSRQRTATNYYVAAV
jgi:hypothetical protein